MVIVHVYRSNRICTLILVSVFFRVCSPEPKAQIVKLQAVPYFNVRADPSSKTFSSVTLFRIFNLLGCEKTHKVED